MKTTKTFPGVNQWDTLNSTYKWRIYLCNGKELVGYSKGLYVSEPADKTVCLERAVRRLANSGYFQKERVRYIQFFYNKFLSGNDEWILTMMPDSYSLGNQELIVTDHRLKDFLTLFYKEITSGKEVIKQIIHPIKHSIEEELFDWRKKRFKTEAELHAFVIKQIDLKKNSEMVMDFFRKYREKWPEIIAKPLDKGSKFPREIM